MTDNFFHGARVKENTDLQTAINDIDSTVIGLVAVAEDADPLTFPLNTPVLVTRVISVLGKAGKTGSLYKSLKAISDQVSTRVIVVRVAEAKAGEDEPTQSQLIIGGTQADGSYTGMFAFLTAEQKTGYRPRILGIPEYDTAEVTAQLRVIAKQLRAFSYSYCDGCDTIAEAKNMMGSSKRYRVTRRLCCTSSGSKPCEVSVSVLSKLRQKRAGALKPVASYSGISCSRLVMHLRSWRHSYSVALV